jgi:hypothetical protein
MNMQLALVEEAPAVAAGDEVARILADARIADEGALLDAIEARRVELQMSNASLEQVAGLCVGHVSKLLSPARGRSPSLRTLDRILAAVQLSIVLVRDPSRAAGASWKPRDEAHVRSRPLSPIALQRARPVVLAELARKASRPKWKDVPAPTFLRALMMSEDAP